MVVNPDKIKKVFDEGKGLEAPAGAFNLGQFGKDEKNCKKKKEKKEKKEKEGNDPWTIRKQGELDPEKLI